MVLNAVETLGAYGLAAAEAPRWKRFEKWNEEWKARAEELKVGLLGCVSPKLRRAVNSSS